MLGAAVGCTGERVWWPWIAFVAYVIGMPACAWFNIPARLMRRRHVVQRVLCNNLQ